MSLIFDRRAELAGQPGCHALIVGVSQYANLGGVAEPPGAFGLKKLASTALTAFRMFRWLEEHKDNLSVKLATCRLLLAPSPDEVAVEPALKEWPHACTFAEFRKAAVSWREDCLSGKDNLAFFYFAGHGIQRTGLDSILLLQDFDFTPGTPMEGTVSVNSIFGGMAPGSSGENIARSQIYFVDACREFPKELKEVEQQAAGAVFNIHLSNVADDRRAPIFYAAVPGSIAYGRIGKATVFGSALLECLNVAARAGQDAVGNLVYEVDSEALKECLTIYFEALQPSEKRDQKIVSGGQWEKVVLHRLPEAPKIPVKIDLIPVESFGTVEFTIEDVTSGALAWQHVRQVPQLKSLELTLPMGFYRMVVKPDPDFAVRYRKALEIAPPRFTWTVFA